MIENKIYNVGIHNSRYVKGIKCALSAMKICNDYVAMPFRKFNNEKKNQIAHNLAEMNMLK